jgi:outer membrane protein OmpA-like peptidoglycan-associated protein
MLGKKFLMGLIGFGFLVLFFSRPCLAQEPDAEGCKDHPMLSRLKNFYISDCESNFDAVEFYVTESETVTVEGQKTRIGYLLQEGAVSPSYLQIRRNFSNAVKSLGGSVLYDEARYASFKIVKNGREIWGSVEGFNDGDSYTLIIVEKGDMAQEVTASEMLDTLNRDGFMALYINFDTGKAMIKPESGPIIEQIASLLKDNADLKLSVEGHTDNVGTPQSNKTLSEERAKSVVAAVVEFGVDAGRLTAVGWGQEKPVADNRTEDGRAKNRRVEIVKK